MSLKFHPKQGCLLQADFSQGFREPEMVKRRLCVVVSKPMKHRSGLVTVVPLSTTPPIPVQPYHVLIDPEFDIPRPWGNRPRWVKADMIYALGFHRLSLLRLGKDHNGRRLYQTSAVEAGTLEKIQKALLAGLGLDS